MLFFILLMLLIVFNGISFPKAGEFNDDYLSKEKTTAINGIFVILIIFSHYEQYADFGGFYDEPYLALKDHLGQMVVSSFLFYSGYGMMESIKKNGEAYIRRIPSKFWQLLFRYDIAVLIFLAVDILLGIWYAPEHILLAFTTWKSLGNSNWYITAILMIYAGMFISFKIAYRFFKSSKDDIAITLTLLITILIVYVQMKIDRPSYCYNTMVLAPIGLLYSKHKERLENIIMKDDISYFVTFAIAVGIYIVALFHRNSFGIEGYTVWAIAFTATLMLLTMKVSVHNNLLEWLGTHVFSIYILQRLPMIILNHYGCIATHKYISLVVVFAITIPIALVFDKASNKIIKIISGNKTAH